MNNQRLKRQNQNQHERSEGEHLAGAHWFSSNGQTKNAVTLPHSAQRKHDFTGKIKDMSKKNKFPARNKIALELLHHILGHRSTR